MIEEHSDTATRDAFVQALCAETGGLMQVTLISSRDALSLFARALAGDAFARDMTEVVRDVMTRKTLPTCLFCDCSVDGPERLALIIAVHGEQDIRRCLCNVVCADCEPRVRGSCGAHALMRQLSEAWGVTASVLAHQPGHA